MSDRTITMQVTVRAPLAWTDTSIGEVIMDRLSEGQGIVVVTAIDVVQTTPQIERGLVGLGSTLDGQERYKVAIEALFWADDPDHAIEQFVDHVLTPEQPESAKEEVTAAVNAILKGREIT